jgi:hypothetical protein
MSPHTLKLLALLTVFAVAPASASQRLAGAAPNHHKYACPHERARAEAAARVWVQASRTPNVPTRITLINGPTLGGGLLGLSSGRFGTP